MSTTTPSPLNADRTGPVEDVRGLIQEARQSVAASVNAVSLMRQLSWTHMLALIPIDDPRERQLRYCEILSPTGRFGTECVPN